MEESKVKSFFREPQNIIALGVSLISICALVVSVRQTQIMSEQRALMYEQAKASVWPRLEISYNKSHKLEDYSVSMYELNITNGGVGPAIITDIRVTFDGEVTNSWGELFAKFNLPEDTPLYIGFRDVNNSLVKIGEDMKFLNLTNNLPIAQGFYDNQKKNKY